MFKIREREKARESEERGEYSEYRKSAKSELVFKRFPCDRKVVGSDPASSIFHE